MKAILAPDGVVFPAPSVPAPRSCGRLLAELDAFAQESPRIISRSGVQFDSAGRVCSLPRYVYLGPRGGGETLRLGIFAAIHGDEPEGALALPRFLEALEQDPEVATGYALFIYPVCNPTGFEDNTRHSRAGKDLNREFWGNSREPEVRFLESEICLHAFHGIVTLHSDDTSDGLYGFATGAVLTEALLEPALRAAEAFLPRNHSGRIDGFSARAGIIHGGYPGMLRTLPGVLRPPFEVTFETPQRSPVGRQVAAINAALRAILVEFRQLMALAQNI
jgi:predicted deacylase